MLNNWKVVLLSLIGATTFWFFNALNKEYDARISYPIEFQFDRDSVVVMKPLDETVTIEVSSGGWNLLRKTFWFNVTPIQIPLDNPTEIGFYTRNSLRPIVTEQLSELKINLLVTDTIFIDIEEKKRQRVRLKADSLKIDLAENYRITSPIRIQPDSALLIGPASFIDSLGYTFELQINSKKISDEFDRDLDIELPNTNLITAIPEEVTVTFDVEKFERKSIEVPVEAENFPADSSYYLAESSVLVFYTIPESKQRDFDVSDFAITADLTMMDKNDSTVMTILVYHPEEIMEIQVIPETLKIQSK